MSDEMDEIWALYLDDGTQSLDQMENALLELQDGDEASAGEHVSALFRAVHTFKGNSRVLGLAVVESRAHYSEDLIGLVRDDGVPLDEEIIDILLLASDVLRDMLEQTSVNRADVDPASSEELMEKLKDKIARCKGEDPAASAEPEAEAVAEEAPVAPAEEAPEVEADVHVEDIAGAMSALDGGDEPEAFEEAPAEEPVAEAEPEPEPEVEETTVEAEVVAEPEPETEPVAADPAPAAEAPVQAAAKRLIDDPSYRDIFKGMADSALERFRKIMGDYASDADTAFAQAKRQSDDLHHAATQMGLTEWAELLEAFMGQPQTDVDTAVEQLAALVLRLEELTRLDLMEEEITAASPDGETYFDQIKPALDVLTKVGVDWSIGEAPASGLVAEHAEKIKEISENRGLVRVADAAGKMGAVDSSKAFRSAELRLYEELSAVERVLVDEAAASEVSPSALLRNWCSDHAFDTITALDAALVALKKGEDLDSHYSAFSRQMRLIFHACVHNKLDTAGQLAMSLIDLFGRVQTSGMPPDSILMHIARGFIDTIELVFDALEQGEIPDTNNLDILFEQASNAAFAQEGLMTATAIERRLNLPDEFHRVLSPESVKTASAAIEAKRHFFIIRGDINEDEKLAEQFLEWISSDDVESITNVTVFEGTKTLFDFLVATPKDETLVITELSAIDGSGNYISVTHTLEDSAATEDVSDAAPQDSEVLNNQGPGLSSEMLESISEVAASQAMVNHMLTDLAETDLADTIESALRTVDGSFEQARIMVRKIVADYTNRLQEVAQVEAQLVSQMAHLQEQTVAIRSRPLETLIRPLEALVATLSRKNKTQAKLTSAGGEMTMDVTLMEHLRKMLRVLLTNRISLQEGAPNALHMAFHRDEERVLVTIEDNGASDDDEVIRAELDEQLLQTSSTMRQISLPGGGMRYHISMPLSMVVLEGMVVGVDDVRYVIPVDSIQSIVQPPSSALRPISAANGQMMLRMDDGAMVSVRCLNNKSPRHLSKEDAHGNRRVFVVLQSAGNTLAIPVDDLLGQQLVLLRPLKGVLRKMKNLTGIALLAGGEVGMVLSTNAILSDGQQAA